MGAGLDNKFSVGGSDWQTPIMGVMDIGQAPIHGSDGQAPIHGSIGQAPIMGVIDNIQFMGVMDNL